MRPDTVGPIKEQLRKLRQRASDSLVDEIVVDAASRLFGELPDEWHVALSPNGELQLPTVYLLKGSTLHEFACTEHALDVSGRQANTRCSYRIRPIRTGAAFTCEVDDARLLQVPGPSVVAGSHTVKESWQFDLGDGPPLDVKVDVPPGKTYRFAVALAKVIAEANRLPTTSQTPS